MNLTSWSVSDGVYKALSDTTQRLAPALYTYGSIMGGGFFFAEKKMSDREILRFPDTVVEEVVQEIENFWELEDNFKAHGVPHKRGILMYGPPGSGKTCTLQLIARDVIERGGVVFEYMGGFDTAYMLFRAIEPDRPLVVTMEDIDSLVDSPSNMGALLNALDGIGDMERVVFVATTNYPEKLQERIANRPSRFDRKVIVDHPSPANRKFYLEGLVLEGDEVDLDQWVRDTQGFSLAHLKELFVSVLLLGNDYQDTVKRLRDMGMRKTSFDGFSVGQYA